MGPVQKSNLVRIGDVLVEINGVSVRKMSFRRVLDLLKCLVYGSENNLSCGNKYGNDSNNSNIALLSIGFEDGRHYAHLQGGIGGGGNGMDGVGNAYSNGGGGQNEQKNQWNLAKENTLYLFRSWIQRARLRKEEEEEEANEENDNENNLHVHFEQESDIITMDSNSNNRSNSKDKNSPKVFVQYEIKCVLIIKQNNQQEEEISWSIWKRYSEIKKLDDHIRKTFHWTMEGIAFPSTNVFRSVFYGMTHSKFVQKRKADFETYWGRLQNVDGLFDFGDPSSSHRYSYMMAEFLDVKREYFQPRVTTIGGSSISVGSRPNVIQIEGEENNFDGSTVSVLSNSAAEVASSTGLRTGSGEGIGLAKSSDRSIASQSFMSGVGKKKKRRKKVAAKSAFERRLLDDL